MYLLLTFLYLLSMEFIHPVVHFDITIKSKFAHNIQLVMTVKDLRKEKYQFFSFQSKSIYIYITIKNSLN
jgi:hypothetical protein